jgi:putative ATP-dependent endonuclease of OLD family
VVCNINSTNFSPYKIFADLLGIPNVVITDGDYYHDVNGESVYGDLHSEEHEGIGYNGNERMIEICSILYGENTANQLTALEVSEQDKKLCEFNLFVGIHTFETDLLSTIKPHPEAKGIIIQTFNALTCGGKVQCNNFKTNLENADYDKCLCQIESSHSKIGKGRFAQRLSQHCTIKMVPYYIKSAILQIVNLTK